MNEPDLSVNLGEMTLKNPLLTASGCYGYGREYADLVPLNAWGALVVKGTTLEPRPGNPAPRLIETPSGLINSVGLQNPGVEYFIKEDLPWLQEQGVPIVVNLAGETEDEYLRLAEIIEEAGEVQGVEINISCPNVEKGGLSFGVCPATVEKLVSRIRGLYSRTLLVKLTPNTEKVTEIAKGAEAGGADGLSLINTIRAMAIDVESQKPYLPGEVGGLSGPAIKPVAVRILWEVAQEVSIPLVGMGGISSARDALEFILAGARAVALGSAVFVHPEIPMEIKGGIKQYMKDQGVYSLQELVGAALPNH